MTSHIARAREVMDPPWDAARERRVLDRALEVHGRKARRWRVLAITSAVATALVLLRVMPFGGSDAEPRLHPAGADPSTAFPPPDSTDGGGRAG